MNTLYVFNPENDIALGNNLRHFTPPRNARLLRRCGTMLMAWIANDGDLIYSGFSDMEWLRQMAPLSKKNITVLSPRNIDQVRNIKPWGWSNAIVGELSHIGLPSNLMPDAGSIDKIRQLSHRRSSIIINARLRDAGITTHIPLEFTDAGELEAYLDIHADTVIKSPWSSSGRGVLHADMTERRQLLRLAEGMIKRQGSILAEPKHERVIDFAMLFEADGNSVRYIGISVFDTINGGNYSGNIVASQQHLTSLLAKYVSINELTALRINLESILSGLIDSCYHGICGVDMMIYLDKDKTPRIAPCIELNLRTTMGYVALCLSRSVAAPGTIGHMNIAYKGNGAAARHLAGSPCLNDDMRLCKGTLGLTPPNDYFDISLTIEQCSGKP